MNKQSESSLLHIIKVFNLLLALNESRVSLLRKLVADEH